MIQHGGLEVTLARIRTAGLHVESLLAFPKCKEHKVNPYELRRWQDKEASSSVFIKGKGVSDVSDPASDASRSLLNYQELKDIFKYLNVLNKPGGRDPLAGMTPFLIKRRPRKCCIMLLFSAY